MGSSGDHDQNVGFQNRSENAVHCPSSMMNTNPFFASAWDPIVSLGSHESFGGSSVVSQAEFSTSPYPGVSRASHLGHYPSDSNLVELGPKFPCFGSGGFSEMVGSFGLGECGQIGNPSCPPNYSLNKEDIGRSTSNGAQCQEDHQLTIAAAAEASPNGKRRKRVADSSSPFHPNKNAEEELQKDLSRESSDGPREQDDKKHKTEPKTSANLLGKQASKQGKDNSHSGEAPKENYIHVRARRGQATNSHSLAERVRREKISERMRLLQELVPGCNKITGKAVMLDEIINYVQSLQQQVEFLSMKLATVNPELNIDIERILAKDILHQRGGSASVLGYSPGIDSNPYSHGLFQAGVPVIPNTNPHFPPVPQAVLDSEIQSLFQMGFDSNSAVDSFGPNGRLKPEL